LAEKAPPHLSRISKNAVRCIAVGGWCGVPRLGYECDEAGRRDDGGNGEKAADVGNRNRNKNKPTRD